MTTTHTPNAIRKEILVSDLSPESLRWIAEGRPWLERLEARIAAYRAGEENPAVPAESPTPDQPALG